jgi:hypothetical protein
MSLCFQEFGGELDWPENARLVAPGQRRCDEWRDLQRFYYYL